MLKLHDLLCQMQIYIRPIFFSILLVNPRLVGQKRKVVMILLKLSSAVQEEENTLSGFNDEVFCCSG
jgi:hypothetical protein